MNRAILETNKPNSLPQLQLQLTTGEPMTIYSNLLLSSLLTLASYSQASLLKTEAGDKKIESITISKSGIVTIEGKDTTLTTLGAGLRTKKVLIANVKVYVAEIFSSEATKFVRTEAEALNSIDLSGTSAVKLNFLRSVDAEKVQVSFRDALKANNVNLTDAGVDAFLKAVSAGGEATEGKSLIIVTQKNADGTESAYYEDTTGKSTKVSGSKGLAKSILSIWLGTPSDDGVAKLKEQILKGL
jgi:hypothetical protein